MCRSGLLSLSTIDKNIKMQGANSNALILTQQTLTTLHLLAPPTLCKMNIPLLSSLQYTAMTSWRSFNISPSQSFRLHCYLQPCSAWAAPVIASSLTHIYNLSLTTATFPSDWKRASYALSSRIGEKSLTHPTTVHFLSYQQLVRSSTSYKVAHCVSFSWRTALSVTSNLDFCRGGRP